SDPSDNPGMAAFVWLNPRKNGFVSLISRSEGVADTLRTLINVDISFYNVMDQAHPFPPVTPGRCSGGGDVQLMLHVGQLGQLVAEGCDAFDSNFLGVFTSPWNPYGDQFPDPATRWCSENPAIASISPTGQVAGLTVGSTKISFGCGLLTTVANADGVLV